MKAITAFSNAISRSNGLLDLHRTSFPRGRPPETGEPPDILRAVVVFAVGAVDSYVHDKISENIMKVVKHCGEQNKCFPPNLIGLLKEQMPIERAISLIFRKRPDEEIRKVVKKYLSERTYQNPEKIEEGLKLLGVKNPWNSIRQQLSLSSIEKAKEFISSYVKRRNQIVHEGDLFTSKRHKHLPRPIGRKFVTRCVSDIAKYVASMDRVINLQLESKYR